MVLKSRITAPLNYSARIIIKEYNDKRLKFLYGSLCIHAINRNYEETVVNCNHVCFEMVDL